MVCSDSEDEDSSDLEDEEFSIRSVEVSSSDESNYGSDDEGVSGEPSNSELIKKCKREHVIGDSPMYLERAISYFDTSTDIDQNMEINNVIRLS